MTGMTDQVAGAAVATERSNRNFDVVAGFLATYGPACGLVILFVILSFMSEAFLTEQNLVNVLRQVAPVAIIACGMTFIIITAGIDLSVGSMLALVGCVGLLVIEATGSDGLGILAGLMAGLAAGMANGYAVARLALPPFIVTLAGLTIYRGIALTITDSTPIMRFEGWYTWLGQGFVLGIPFPIVALAAVAVTSHVVLTRTAFGVHVLATGGNEVAARLSGIRTAHTKFWVYALTGLLVGFAGMILAGRLSSAQPGLGVMFELDVIAAVVIGGTSLMGGRGTVWSTMVGALIIGLLNNGFNLLNVDSHIQLIAKGLIIITAVFLDQYLKGHTASRGHA